MLWCRFGSYGLFSRVHFNDIQKLIVQREMLQQCEKTRLSGENFWFFCFWFQLLHLHCYWCSGWVLYKWWWGCGDVTVCKWNDQCSDRIGVQQPLTTLHRRPTHYTKKQAINQKADLQLFFVSCSKQITNFHHIFLKYLNLAQLLLAAWPTEEMGC